MPVKKNIKKGAERQPLILTSFQKQKRQLFYTMAVLIVLSACALFFLSWQFSRLQLLAPHWPQAFFSTLFSGELLQEEEILTLNKESTNFDPLSFVAANDGRSFAYILKNNDSQQVIVNNEAGPIFKEITFMAFSPDAKSFAYTAKQGKKEVAVINGQLGKEYDWIFAPRLFSPDSRYFIYKARQGSKESLVVNHQESRFYDRIYEPFLSQDKKYLVFFALDANKLWRGSLPLNND